MVFRVRWTLAVAAALLMMFPPQLKRDPLGSLDWYVTKTQLRDLAVVGGAVVVLAIILAIPFLAIPRDLFTWEPPPPGKVLAERISPDSQLFASVTAADSIGHYVFTLRAVRSGEIAARREVWVPVGWHPHIVRIEWVPDGSRAIATFDHDFGADNARVALQRPRAGRRSSAAKLPNKRLKLAARVDYGMNLSSARRSLSAVR